MKLLESTKNKITKDKNGENVPHLEIKSSISYCNTVNNDYQINKIQDSYIYLFLINHLVIRGHFIW